MSEVELGPNDLARFQALADQLIQQTDTMPAPSQVGEYEDWLRRAVRACGYHAPALRRALDLIPPDVDWETAKAFAVREPEAFHMMSELLSAAYFMAPEVLAKLHYPVERRQPAGLEDFANEFESGILDPVMQMEPRYRDTR